jgi:hypothetical protein
LGKILLSSSVAMPEKYNGLLCRNTRKNTYSTVHRLFDSVNTTAFFRNNFGDKKNTPSPLWDRGNTTALPMTMENFCSACRLFRLTHTILNPDIAFASLQCHCIVMVLLYFLRPLILFDNTNVSRHILISRYIDIGED